MKTCWWFKDWNRKTWSNVGMCCCHGEIQANSFLAAQITKVFHYWTFILFNRGARERLRISHQTKTFFKTLNKKGKKVFSESGPRQSGYFWKHNKNKSGSLKDGWKKTKKVKRNGDGGGERTAFSNVDSVSNSVSHLRVICFSLLQ